MDLIPVRDPKDRQLPWKPASCYKFHAEGRYPDILIKIGGKLFVDLDAFNARATKIRDAQIKKAKKVRRGLAT